VNLEDVLSEGGLQQDAWSLTKPKFGEDNQLTVVGWSGRNHVSNKYYIIKCSTCSQDTELFGGGYFRAFKNQLVNRDVIPCGCSRKAHWSKEQQVIKCTRKAEALGYKFSGFVGEFTKGHTKIKLLCELHGEWVSGTVENLLHRGVNVCPECRQLSFGLNPRKSDEDNIQSFFASGAFHPDTKFWRSERQTKQGNKSYWHLYCPECGTQGEAFVGSLRKGHISCGCSTWQQTEAYINLVIEADTPIAIKFGIANNSSRRTKVQNRFSCYEVKNHSVYKFPDVNSCRNAERECKQELECGIVLKRDMPDGYSETTWVYNLEKIIEIYENNQGVRLDRLQSIV
jgi:hypothetical protein